VSSNSITNELNQKNIRDDIYKYLEYNLGNNQFIIHTDIHSNNLLWIDIYPIANISVLGNVSYIKFKNNYIENIRKKISSKYKIQLKINLMNQTPKPILDELKRRHTMKIILLSALLGVISLFIGTIIFGTIKQAKSQKKYTEQLSNKNISLEDYIKICLEKFSDINTSVILYIDDFNFLIKKNNIDTLFFKKEIFNKNYFFNLGNLTIMTYTKEDINNSNIRIIKHLQ